GQNSHEILNLLYLSIGPERSSCRPEPSRSERMLRAALLSTIGLCCWSAAFADEFKLDCHPFSLPTQARPIDSRCGGGGSAADGSDTAKKLQNEVKNALCSQGDAVTLTMADFMALQNRARQLGISFGAEGSPPRRTEHLPEDRTKLQSKDFHTPWADTRLGRAAGCKSLGS